MGMYSIYDMYSIYENPKLTNYSEHKQQDSQLIWALKMFWKQLLS